MVTEPDRVKGRKVSVATIALGSMCRHITAVLETPKRLGRAHVIEVAPAQELGAHHARQRSSRENSSRKISSTQKLGVMMLPRMMSR